MAKTVTFPPLMCGTVRPDKSVGWLELVSTSTEGGTRAELSPLLSPPSENPNVLKVYFKALDDMTWSLACRVSDTVGDVKRQLEVCMSACVGCC